MDACVDKVAVLQCNTLPAVDAIVSEVLNNLEGCQGNSITINEVMKSIQQVARENQTIVDPRALDDACNQLFSGVDPKDGVISRADLR